MHSPARTPRAIFSSLSVLVLVAACSAEPDTEQMAEPAQLVAATPTLQDAVDLGVRNAREPIPGVLTGAQPTPEQMEALADAGYQHFISLRPTTEEGAGWEEEAAPAWGDFDRLEIADASSLTRENVERFAALLDATGDAPTVVYCASGNRVGAMLALKAYWLDGVGAEEALELGLSAGMTRLEAPVRELLGMPSAP